MEFLDKLGKKASNAYKMTADKTGKIAKETKLKLKINELRTQVNDIYEYIGKKVYEKHIREEDISIKKDIEEYCTKIDVLSDEIDNLLKQCLELKDKKQCPKCYKEIAIEDNFCPNCGQKQTQDQPREVDILEDLENSEIDEDNHTEEKIVKENLQKDLENSKEQEGKENSQENLENSKEQEGKENLQENLENSKEQEDTENSAENEEKTSDNKEEDNNNTTSNLEKTVAIESDVEMQEDEDYKYNDENADEDYEYNDENADEDYEYNDENADEDYEYNEQNEDEDY